MPAEAPSARSRPGVAGPRVEVPLSERRNERTSRPGGRTHLALVGPTASGKSSLALAVAEVLGDVEIVTLDSMQVYRGMDLGTAKATLAEQRRVRHHLLDVVEPNEEWSVARTQSAVSEVVAEIEGRGHRACLVGGTGLYVQAVVDGLTLPGDFPGIRARLEVAASSPGGLARLHAELDVLDPEAARRIEPTNHRRVVRALEVVNGTGRPFSSFGPGMSSYGEPVFPVRLAGVWLPRPVLAARIERRARGMLAAGLADEVALLARRHPEMSRTAAQAIGYKELLSGRAPVDVLPEIVARTRALARRQRMWFRRDPRITWFATDDDPERLLGALLTGWALDDRPSTSTSHPETPRSHPDLRLSAAR